MRLLSLPAVRRRDRDASRLSGPLGRERRGLGLALLILAPLAGCGGYGQPDEDFETTLTAQVSCGDVTFFAHDEDDEILLEVVLPPVEDQLGGGASTFTYTLPLAGIEITVWTGEGISARTCTDVVENGRPDVEQTWTAIEGDLTLVVTPGEVAADPVRGTLELKGVHLQGNLQPLDIERFTFDDLVLFGQPG